MNIRVILLFLLSNVIGTYNAYADTDSSSGSEQKPTSPSVQIDFEALYQMPEPPEYTKFPYYGAYLFSIADQKTPKVLNPEAPTPDNVSQTMDVEFKEIDGIDLGMDIYQPTGDKTPNPLIFIIHGGGWEGGDKRTYRPYGINFAAMGYTVASINYRLSGQAPFPAQIEDIRDAIVYLQEHAAKHNIDPSRMTIFGSSAGGHLTSFTGFAANSPNLPYLKGVDEEAIKAIITIYGPQDLTAADIRLRPDTQKFMGGSFEKVPDVYLEASPINHLDKNDPPVLVIHGTLDSIVPVRHSELLVEKLKELGIPHTYDPIKGWSHVMDFFSPIAERTLWQCYHFLKERMPSDEMLSE